MSSYEAVKNNKKAIDGMYHTLNNLGIDVEYDREKY